MASSDGSVTPRSNKTNAQQTDRTNKFDQVTETFRKEASTPGGTIEEEDNDLKAKNTPWWGKKGSILSSKDPELQ